MLFRKPTLEAIQRGRVTLAFRHWARPTVKAGGTLKTRAGLLAIDAVERISKARITDVDARKAGSASRAALLEELARWPDGALYRIRFRRLGEDPRVALRNRKSLPKEERALLEKRLARLDAASPHGPWTATVLRLIDRRPGTRAPDLAASLGRETQPFKRDVRKLKNLGLTISLEVGYRLSPRGRAFLRTLPKKSPGSSSPGRTRRIHPARVGSSARHGT